MVGPDAEKPGYLDSPRCRWNYLGSFTGCAVSRGKASEHLHDEGRRQKDATCTIREQRELQVKVAELKNIAKVQCPPSSPLFPWQLYKRQVCRLRTASTPFFIC